MNTVLWSKESGIATIILNRPHVLNAVDRELAEDALRIFAEVAADKDVRVAVLTGAGKAFCAGGDLAYMQEHNTTAAQAREFIALAGNVTRSICELQKPVIGMINGVAAGIGANFLLACDLAVAASSFRFGQSFAKVGLMPDGGGHYFLPRAVGLSKAKELMFTGKLLDAAAALQLGLVNRVAPDDKLGEETYALARELAAGPPLALAMIKRTLAAALENDLNTVLDMEASSQALLLQTEDAREGIASFAERRAPKFTGA